MLLGVHAKTNYGVTENLYGFIPMTNALMVVFFQAMVTRQTKKYAPLPVLALGSLFYATAVTSVAFGSSFPAFWLSMVIMTIGELMEIQNRHFLPIRRHFHHWDSPIPRFAALCCL